MFDRRTLRVLAILFSVYVLLWIPAMFSTGYLNSPLGIIAAIPVLSVYLFSMLGVPGLLQGNGACGWGWCAPSIAGWVFVVVFWVALVWVAARGIAAIFSQKNAASDGGKVP